MGLRLRRGFPNVGQRIDHEVFNHRPAFNGKGRTIIGRERSYGIGRLTTIPKYLNYAMVNQKSRIQAASGMNGGDTQLPAYI